ncbi:MAG: inner membrane protein YpjD [Terriglobia bacterium]
MSLLWLWVALGLYSLGLLHALVTVVARREAWFRAALAAIALGFIFHFVSLVERALTSGRFPVTNIAEATSLFAFLITLGFLLVYWLYRTTSLSVFTFPIVFAMTLASALSQRPGGVVEPLLERRWVSAHISLTLAGYTALILAFLAGLMYLMQERELKRRKPRAFYYRLPPLETVDRVGSLALALGFPFITVGLVIGLVVAAGEWNAGWMGDPKVWFSFAMWVIYLLLILARFGVGWRGHKAALFSIVGLAMALATWGANYLSENHYFLGH